MSGVVLIGSDRMPVRRRLLMVVRAITRRHASVSHVIHIGVRTHSHGQRMRQHAGQQLPDHEQRQQ